MNPADGRGERLLRFLATPADPELPAADRLGPYRILRRLGAGGCGVVYEAEDPRLRRRVALKIIALDGEDAPPLERLLRESRIAGALRHPGIVALHDAGPARDASGGLCFYLAMELVQGRSLAAVLRDSRPPRAELLRMLADLAEAVGYAHSRGVVHRDLKPANVLVEDGGRVMLTDFGAARCDALASRLTRSTQLIGTPVYMAPEQAAGRIAEIDARTDVHALGEILYEILTGRMPYEASTPQALFRRILEDEPRMPRSIDPTIPPALEAVCLKAMDKLRERRYAEAGAFASELRRAMENRPVEARSPTAAGRLWRRVRRRPAAVAAAVLAGLGLIAAAAFGRSPHPAPRDAAHGAFLVQEAEALAAPAVRRLPATDPSQQGALEEASAKLHEAILLDPSSVRARVLLGRVREGQGRDAEAVERYADALTLDPAHREARIARAMVRWRLGDAAGAEEDYSAVLAGEPEAIDALNGRARAFHRLGRTDEAMRDWGECLRLQPLHSSALANRGSALAELRDWAGAERDLRQALASAPAHWPMREAVERRLAQTVRARSR